MRENDMDREALLKELDAIALDWRAHDEQCQKIQHLQDSLTWGDNVGTKKEEIAVLELERTKRQTKEAKENEAENKIVSAQVAVSDAQFDLIAFRDKNCKSLPQPPRYPYRLKCPPRPCRMPSLPKSPGSSTVTCFAGRSH